MTLCGFPVLRNNHHALCMRAARHLGTCMPVPNRLPQSLR